MSNEWSGGLAHEVVNKLKEAYQPKDSVTEVELYERLLSVKMKAKNDPRTPVEMTSPLKRRSVRNRHVSRRGKSNRVSDRRGIRSITRSDHRIMTRMK